MSNNLNKAINTFLKQSPEMKERIIQQINVSNKMPVLKGILGSEKNSERIKKKLTEKKVNNTFIKEVQAAVPANAPAPEPASSPEPANAPEPAASSLETTASEALNAPETVTTASAETATLATNLNTNRNSSKPQPGQIELEATTATAPAQITEPGQTNTVSPTEEPVQALNAVTAVKKTNNTTNTEYKVKRKIGDKYGPEYKIIVSGNNKIITMTLPTNNDTTSDTNATEKVFEVTNGTKTYIVTINKEGSAKVIESQQEPQQGGRKGKAKSKKIHTQKAKKQKHAKTRKSRKFRK